MKATLRLFCFAVVCLLVRPSAFGQAASTGDLHVTVKDPKGSVVTNATVTVRDVAKGLERAASSDGQGGYSVRQLAPGTYSVSVDVPGFAKAEAAGVAVTVGQMAELPVALTVAGGKEVIEVSSQAELVETSRSSTTDTIGQRRIDNLPINGRNYINFTLTDSQVVRDNAPNTGAAPTSGLNMSGQRARSNLVNVDGADATDNSVNGVRSTVSQEAVQEFQIITNSYAAEYGRASGGVVNIITRSGSNDFHGDVFGYLRNRNFQAVNPFSTTPDPAYTRVQAGVAFGGPIKKDRTFFFASYEGRRIRQGIPSPAVTVPTSEETPSPTNVVNGQIVANFTDVNPTSPTGPFFGSITNSSILTNRPGCQAANAAIGGGPIADGNTYASMFPAGLIPLACMDATAVDLLQFVPSAPGDSNLISTVPTKAIRGDQFTVKVDHRINDKQNLSIYYYFDDDRTLQPFSNFELAGADVPGFGSILAERFQQWNITHTWTLTSSTVNEFRFNYNREGQGTFQHPQNTELVQESCPTAPAWLSNVTGAPPCFYGDVAGNTYGIHPFLGAGREGLPSISVSGGFSLGNDAEGELPQVGNSFQWSDNLTKVSGNHTLKFGVDFRRQQFNQFYYYNVNGSFAYYGGGPNDPVACSNYDPVAQQCNSENLYPDYLLGLPDSYGQGSAQVENVRNTGLYLFAQDSWKIKPNLTLNYGFRWELNTPLADKAQHVETFRPGQMSTIFPCGGPNTDCTSQDAIGLVVPGDPGVPAGMTQTYYKAFAPRIGISWSPGNSAKTSIRAGWGLFYNPIEQLVLAQFGAEPPFGGSTTLSETQFNQPFLDQSGTFGYLNPFNGVLNPKRGTSEDWAALEPIDLFGDFQPHMRTQYSAQYNLTIQRELTKDMKLEVGYVGSQGHRLLATHDINYSNPQTCVDISNIAAANAAYVTAGLGGGPTTCGQFAEDAPFYIPGGTVLPVALHLPYAQNNSVIPAGTTIGPNGITLVGLRPYSSPQCDPLTGIGCPINSTPVFTGIFAQDTIASSAYNSLQISLDKRFARGLQFTAAYTFSKSIDEASSFEGILNPLPNAHNPALSLFDAKHRFVVSYTWDVPARKYDGFRGKVVDGWQLSGITTYQTGFPIRITSSSDNELMNSADFEYPGEPDQIAPFSWQRPQGNGGYYFNTPSNQSSIFTESGVFGYVGSAPRTICCGPGISETDVAVEKLIPVTEHTHFEFRGELFNVFNHTQFYNPDGNSTDGQQFGQVTEVKDPRLAQFALKFYF